MDDYFTPLFGLFILAMGVWMIQLGRKSAEKVKQAKLWPTASATIIKSEVRKMPGSNAKFRFDIEYRYQVNDKQYTNNNIAIGGEVTSGRILAEKRQEKYPEGSSPTVYYNPDNANEAYLEPVIGRWRTDRTLRRTGWRYTRCIITDRPHWTVTIHPH